MDTTRVLWAKKSVDQNEELWLPLPVHMDDVAEVAKLLWDRWISGCVKSTIISGILTDGKWVCPEVTEQLISFLAFIHDVGKATPIFQSKIGFRSKNLDELISRGIRSAGFPLNDSYSGSQETRHGLVSHVILRRNGIDDSVSVVVGGHHGLPPSTNQILTLEEGGYNYACGFSSPLWYTAQDELVEKALIRSGIRKDYIKTIRLSRKAQVLLSGIIILADWIASDAHKMPLIPIEKFNANSKKRAAEAYSTLSLPELWNPDWDLEEIYQRRFFIEETRPIQDALKNAVASCYKPGIFVVEAPMGEGKTEAALAAAELLANKVGCRGIYFALPSQATSDAMFTRVIDWVERFDHFGEKFSVRLVHGRADLNPLQNTMKLTKSVGFYNGEEDREQVAVVHEWLSGRKKGLLADFTVGTIDQVLMTALRQKHLVLRHLGLSSKVVIIDECHAYDVYMESYLLMALKWLGAYGVPVIVLSATLPAERRRKVIESYINAQPRRDTQVPQWVKKNTETVSDKPDKKTGLEQIDTNAYPLVTYTDGLKVHNMEVLGAAREMVVELQRIKENQLVDILTAALVNGGVAGVIVNTVKRSQKIFIRLKEVFRDSICLLHAQFLASERTQLEKTLVQTLGPDNGNFVRPNKMIVVGTQIFEQSMDIDFDVLVTDLCPMDLLLQRVGRLHRHKRNRPELLLNAVCYVMGADWGDFEHGSEGIYGKYLLMRTCAALPDNAVLPADIPRLVKEVYDNVNDVVTPEEITNDVNTAKETWAMETQKRVNRANAFQISSPYQKSSLVGWLDTSASDAQGDAAVRDGSDSLDVIVVQRRGEKICFLPWIDNGKAIPLTKLDDELSRQLLGCTVRLPAMLSAEWIIDKVINELEDIMFSEGLTKGWYQSHWLKGMLVLILNEYQESTLCCHRIRYDPELGLCML